MSPGWLDAAAVAWLVAAVALMALSEARSPWARAARRALTPVAVALGGAFAWKVYTVFGPMLANGVG